MTPPWLNTMCPSRHSMWWYLGGAVRTAVVLPLAAVLASLVLLLPWCPAAVGAAATTFRVGLVGPWGCDPFFGKALPSVAAQLAVKHINADPALAHAETFDYTLLQEPCETSRALETYLGFNSKASGFIGPINNGYCDAASLVGRSWNKSVFSWSCVGEELDDAHSHPTFTHSMPRPAKVLAKLMRYLKWAHVAVVSSFEEHWVETATKLANSLRGRGMAVRTVEFIENTPHGVQNTLDKIHHMGDIRLVILCMHSVLLGGVLQRRLLETAYDMGLTQDGRLAFVPYDTLLYSLPYGGDTAQHYAAAVGGDSARLRAAYDAVLTVTVDSPGTSFYEAFASAVRRGEVAKHLRPQQVSPLFGTIYSSIVLMAHAVQALRLSGDHLSGETLAKHARNLTFKGFSHPIRTSPSGAAIVNYLVLDTDGTSWELRPTHMIDIENQRVAIVGREIHYPSGGHGPSEDHSCWFTKGVICTGGVDMYTATGIIFGPLLFSVLAIGLGDLIRRFLRMMRHRSKMLVSMADVTFVHPALYTKKAGEQTPVISDVSELEHSLSSVSLETPPNHEISCVMVYEGDWAWVKKLPPGCLGPGHRTRDVFQMLTGLHHENVNPFFAFYYEAGVLATVTEYASRGSLEDLVLNQDVKLDWMFKYSLLMDIIKGMRYLHNNGLVHGRLKSRNCVVDGRFVLRVTDYGYYNILDAHSCDVPQPDPEDLLWSAPEILRMGYPFLGTPAGDVYSFSIILQELVSRGRPYCMLHLPVPELLNRLRKTTSPPCRPVLSSGFAPNECIDLAHVCWHENPEKRPNFDEIFEMFKEINRGMKYNIIDSMLRMLEQYSSNLAELIKERTEELEIEKHKTEKLLTQMLPPSVAQALKTGGKVEPEDFDSVSLYFSDIVGFTTISFNSEPTEVVDLLNDLYTVFDAIIGDHDVYKVETIGDAYMVASGVPVRNGLRHAAEIANMSLDILSAVGVFKMRHMPDVPVRIRIGLHSGPCVAGVVGLTMPRYCLFGETVTTASLMESSGQPSRIQAHENTVKILMDLKMGYKCQLRGRSEIKGALTYWLTGYDGFKKPLPVPPNFKSKQQAQKKMLAEIATSKKKRQKNK